MDETQQPTPTPDRTIDSLFVSENEENDEEYMDVAEVEEPQQPTLTEPEIARPRSASVPAGEDDAKPPTSAPEEQIAEEVVSPFVQKLKDIEVAARAQMAAWDPVYLGQATGEATGSQAPGTKRKGTSLLAHFNCTLTSRSFGDGHRLERRRR
jgi:hypothetical protein